MNVIRTLLAGAALACLATSALAATTVAPDTRDPSYRKGSIDRDSWEYWFNGLSGDYLSGASYWADNRNKGPVPCERMGMQTQFWMRGCMDARTKLSAIDFWRKNDAQYWNGWNKKQPFVPGIPGEAAAPSYPTASTTRDAAAGNSVRADATQFCVGKVQTQMGEFDAYYDPKADGWQTFGVTGGNDVFRACMRDQGYTIGFSRS